MIHPDTELQFINPEVGYGVVATKFIPEGTITWIQDGIDRVFKASEVQNLHFRSQEILNKYAFRNRDGDYVLCWDLAKYVNHSFKSNCFSTAYGFEIAIRDILKGEELTDDYGYLNLEEPFKAYDEGTKRKVVYPDDLMRYYDEWDVKIRNSLLKFNNVAQPLAVFLSEQDEAELQKVLSGKKTPDSILKLYCGEIPG